LANAWTAGIIVVVPFCSSISFWLIGVSFEKKDCHTCVTCVVAAAWLKLGEAAAELAAAPEEPPPLELQEARSATPVNGNGMRTRMSSVNTGLRTTSELL
jgi:hypothetical protein